jgi:hypothetical protein
VTCLDVADYSDLAAKSVRERTTVVIYVAGDNYSLDLQCAMAMCAPSTGRVVPENAVVEAYLARTALDDDDATVSQVDDWGWI